MLAQLLSGKDVRLVLGKSQVRFPAGFLWTLSLSKAFISLATTGGHRNQWPRVKILVCVHVHGM